MKAVIYIRVSEQRQIDNTSLASQEAACLKWCEDHELEVDRVFTEAGESAKTANRAEFQRMFRYLETVQGLISHVVVWKQDRFSRRVGDTSVYKDRLRSLGIRLASVTEQMDDTPLGDFTSHIMSAVDELDNRNRALRSNVSMRAAFRSGRWTWVAPLGYLSQKRPLKCFAIDSVRGPLIVKLFEAVASGHVTKANALAHITHLGMRTRKGKPLNQQRVSDLLKNELFCGWMYAKKWNLRIKGDYQPLISEELFQRVQGVLSGRALVVTPHKKLRSDFPLKGTLRCNVCNAVVTAGLSKGGMGVKYGYYRCHKAKGHLSVRAEVIENALEVLLSQMQPEPIRLNAVVTLFRSIWSDRMKVSEDEENRMRQTLLNLEAKEARLIEALSDGAMSNASFKKASAPLIEQAEAIRQQISNRSFEQLDLDDAVDYLQSMCLNLTNLWDSNDIAERSSLLKLLFPLGISHDGKSFELKSTNSLFMKLADTETSDEMLASPTRFELVLSP